VYEGRDAAINDRIGRILLDILPAGAEKITAKAIVAEDWAEVAFEYADEAGNVGSFDFANTPSRAAGDISEALMGLRKAHGPARRRAVEPRRVHRAPRRTVQGRVLPRGTGGRRRLRRAEERRASCHGGTRPGSPKPKPPTAPSRNPPTLAELLDAWASAGTYPGQPIEQRDVPCWGFDLWLRHHLMAA